MGAELFFVRLLDDLRVLGAERPLLEIGERCRRDEHKHGLWGRDWAVFFGHPDTSDPVAQRRRALTFPGASARENRILRIAFAAFTETCGCQVLADIRPRITFDALRKNNQLHLADEVVHARLAWGYLATLTQRDRELVGRYVPTMLELLPRAVCDGPESDDLDHLVPWGYLTPSLLHAAHGRALREVIEPGLAHWGIRQQLQRGAA